MNTDAKDNQVHLGYPRRWWAAALAIGILVGGCGTGARKAPFTSATSSSTAPTSGSSAPRASTSGSAATSNGAEYAAYYKVNGTATVQPGSPLAMKAGDFAFSPNTLSAKAGTPVHISIENTSPEPHNFSLPAFAVSANLPAGATTAVHFTPTRAGTYYFYCNLPGHPEAGMVGKLTVS